MGLSQHIQLENMHRCQWIHKNLQPETQNCRVDEKVKANKTTNSGFVKKLTEHCSIGTDSA